MLSSTSTSSAVPSGRRRFQTSLFIRVRNYSFPVAIFLISRAAIGIGLFVAANVFVHDQSVADTFQRVWTLWDGGWYTAIAANGYHYVPYTQSSVAFFPFLPILMRLVGFVTDPTTAGLVIVNVACALADVLLYALVRFEFPDDEGVARRTLLYIAFFPTAIFSMVIYTESLFLLFSVAAFYFARRGMWSISIAAAILCTATHVTGILLVLVVALEWARAHGLTLSTILQRSAWRNLWQGVRRAPLTIAAIALIPFGLFSYMGYLYAAYNSPTLFYDVQSSWGRFVGTPFSESLHLVLGFFSPLAAGQQIPVETLFNVPAFVLTLVLAVLVWRRFGATYGLYALASVLIPAMSALISYVRYTMVMFPLFMLLALWGKRAVVHQTIFSLFCMLLGIVLVIYVSNIFLA